MKLKLMIVLMLVAFVVEAKKPTPIVIDDGNVWFSWSEGKPIKKIDETLPKPKNTKPLSSKMDKMTPSVKLTSTETQFKKQLKGMNRVKYPTGAIVELLYPIPYHFDKRENENGFRLKELE